MIYLAGEIKMEAKKRVTFKFIILLLFASAVLAGCGKNYINSTEPLHQLIEQGRINELRLTIYYVSPYILTVIAWDVDNLINSEIVKKIVINGGDLEKHIDLLNRISNIYLTPVIRKSYLDARIYYVFETEKEGKIFDVAMWGYSDGDGKSIFVNGFAAKDDGIFYDVIMPFLPEDAAKELGKYTGRGN